MDAQTCPGIIAAAVLLAVSSSQPGNAGPVEPLDGMQGITSASSVPAHGSERGPLLPVHPSSALMLPHGDPPSRFGSPMPPNQLTPAPLLPFNPNRSLVPAPSAPPHPPNPARAETRANPAPYSGSGRVGR
jgi:hypothetical protein